MPRIPDEHLQAVVFVYPSETAAHDGEHVGGSGFIINTASADGWMIRYVVTNQHVVDHGGHWIRLNHPRGHYIVHVPPEEWTRAPNGDDFAIANLRLPAEVQPMHLTLVSLALTREKARELKVGPGDEIYMVGRFIRHGGRVMNNPIARFGSLSLMPDPTDPVLDGRGKEVEAYLVEMRSHAGFSGSPVFLMILHNSFRGQFGDTSMDDNIDRFRLLGIDTGHKIDPLPVEQWDDGWEKVHRQRVPHYSDVAIVSPIWKVVDLLNGEDQVERRNELGREMTRKRGHEATASDVADEMTTPDWSGEQFEEGLRKVSRRTRQDG